MSAVQTLYYVTNRKGSNGEPGRQEANVRAARQRFFGPHRSESLSYGSYSLNGEVEPKLERLDGCESFPIDNGDDVLVFVHGFNSQFNSAMAGLVALSSAVNSNNVLVDHVSQDEFKRRNMIPILYSWPSMGSPFAYMQDECSAQYSYAHFKQFLDVIEARVGDTSRIHIVAHSLGCQLVYRYLLDGTSKIPNEALDPESGTTITDTQRNKSVKAGTVIFSCPDLDYQTVSMDSEREKFSRSVARGFMLVSDVDAPLELSRALHGYTRLGRPALPSAQSLFWGTFRTGSIANIFSTAAHAPEIMARRAIKRLASGFRNPDEVWQDENRHLGIEFAENVKMYDFTIADKGERRIGHSICVPLIASLLTDGSPPIDWSTETIVKIPDEFVECTVFPYARSKPYENDAHRLFNYQKLIPPVEHRATKSNKI